MSVTELLLATPAWGGQDNDLGNNQIHPAHGGAPLLGDGPHLAVSTASQSEYLWPQKPCYTAITAAIRQSMSALCPQTEPNSHDAKRFGRPRRTREMQQAKKFRSELLAHVGASPSTTQRALVEQAVQLQLRLSVMDRRFAETCSMTAHDSRVYLAWANSLARLLRQIGVKPATQRVETLDDIVTEITGAAA